MPEASPAPRRVLAWAALEAAVLVLPAAAFLSLYVQHPAGSALAVAPHLKLLLSAWLAFVALRMAVGSLAPASGLARWGLALLAVAGLLSWWGYQALVLVGLASWGRVVSAVLVLTYVGQAPQLAQAVGLAFWPMLAGLALLASLLVAGAARHWAGLQGDWAAYLATRLPVRWCSVVALAAAALAGLHTWAYLEHPPLAQREPVALTLFAHEAGNTILNQGMAESATLAAAAQADRQSYRLAQPAARPNVVLIVADALRADRLGLLGYPRPTTPALDAAASAGRLRLATTLRSACAESTCGLMALARSKFAHQLTRHDVSLHEVLRRHGWRVHLLLGGDHTNFYGLRNAFGPVDSYFDGSMLPRGGYVNDDRFLLDRLDKLPPFNGQPLLLQLHLMASHTLGARLPEAQRFQPAAPYMTWVSKGNALFAQADPRATNHYDNGVASADLIIQGALQRLQQAGYLDDAWVIVTGDHGEMLGEHGEFGHAKGVYEPALTVPLVMLRYGPAPATPQAPVPGLASQVDVAPTVLHALGLPRPASWSGRPLQLAHDRRYVSFTQGHQTGLYDSGKPGQLIKYWRHQRSGQEFVYDLQADPAEQRNLAASLPAEQLAGYRRAVLEQASAMVQ